MSLRPVREEDGTRLLAWRNTPAIRRWMLTDHMIGEAEHTRWLKVALVRAGRRDWIVERDGEPAGLANLVQPGGEARHVDWGVYLADPAARGAGLGARAAFLLFRHAFRDLRFAEVRGEVLADNAASLALHARFGFTRDDDLRGPVGKGVVVRFGLPAREWPGVEARLAALGEDGRLEP